VTGRGGGGTTGGGGATTGGGAGAPVLTTPPLSPVNGEKPVVSMFTVKLLASITETTIPKKPLIWIMPWTPAK
jgi:hypothetical protein